MAPSSVDALGLDGVTRLVILRQGLEAAVSAADEAAGVTDVAHSDVVLKYTDPCQLIIATSSSLAGIHQV